jgi:hypothetical protein
VAEFFTRYDTPRFVTLAKAKIERSISQQEPGDTEANAEQRTAIEIDKNYFL